MKGHAQIYSWIVILTVLGLGMAAYKYFELGFPLLPGERQTVWTMEAKIEYEGLGKEAIIALNLPDNTGNLAVIQEQTGAIGYGFHFEERAGESWGVWAIREVEGPQQLYFQAHVYQVPNGNFDSAIAPPTAPQTVPTAAELFDETTVAAAESVMESARSHSADNITLATAILQTLDLADSIDSLAPIKKAMKTKAARARLLVNLLAIEGVPARTVRGLYLGESKSKGGAQRLVEVWSGDHWNTIDPNTGKVGLPDNFLIWQRGDSALLEVTGGKDSRVSFSVIPNRRLAKNVALFLGKARKAALVDFSIYSLPVETQNAFALLLLIPLGALVVVILRNLVGISTSGTFMPILITLVFLQTTLVTGLILFLLIVSTGLAIRSYLSRLNLLLVPRISAVLVVVILLYVGVSVVSLKMGIMSGLAVTFFPMVIIAWTIERLSILWEEEGPKQVFIQGGGSLFTAIIAYFVMSSHFISNLIFNFPELLLVVLAIILLIGNYTGYRLTELRRFEPMGRE